MKGDPVAVRGDVRFSYHPIASTSELGGAALKWKLVAVADFDGDQFPDLLWRDDSGNVLLWLLDGTTLRQTAGYPGIDLGWQIQSASDLDGDGVADILWRHADVSLLAWLLDHGEVKSALSHGLVDPAWRIQGCGAGAVAAVRAAFPAHYLGRRTSPAGAQSVSTPSRLSVPRV